MITSASDSLAVYLCVSFPHVTVTLSMVAALRPLTKVLKCAVDA
jgi:hypothetical protein